MGGLTHFLGVECKHCHQEPDYAADTHNKQIANWMARELVPRLQQARPAPTASRRCGARIATLASPSFLGNPRRRDFAIEWMTTHLVEDFETTAGQVAQVPQCHGGDLGSPEFQPKIILSELSGLPLPPAPAAEHPPLQPARLAAAGSASACPRCPSRTSARADAKR